MYCVICLMPSRMSISTCLTLFWLGYLKGARCKQVSGSQQGCLIIVSLSSHLGHQHSNQAMPGLCPTHSTTFPLPTGLGFNCVGSKRSKHSSKISILAGCVLWMTTILRKKNTHSLHSISHSHSCVESNQVYKKKRWEAE